MTLYKWLQTASADATANSTINWAEGQSPSSVNDFARAMMAATAKYRDDIGGAIVTGGTSTAYTMSSFQTFDSLAHMNGTMLAFTPHATSGAIVTLNVDGLGAKPLRSSPSVELLAGTLIQGTPYVATYSNSDAVWYLRSFYGNPYNVPLAGGMDFWGTTVPNSSFAFPAGQAISRRLFGAVCDHVHDLRCGRRQHHIQPAGQDRPHLGNEGGKCNSAYIDLFRRRLDCNGFGWRQRKPHADDG